MGACASVFASAFVVNQAMAQDRTDSTTAGNQPVGSVTLTLGKAVIVDREGHSTAVRRGSPIFPGDRVETSDGGHVHVRFVDGALVSVRPTSRLWIEDYQYNVRQVQKSLVRFRLEQGVVRAISGAAAEGAKDRFRLNTPLVAIGVRGTDFVVRTDAAQTLATVNQGAIVMAPFGTGCLQQGNGPCGVQTAKLLTDNMVNQRLEYSTHLAQPEIRSVPDWALNQGAVLAAKAAPQQTLESASTRDSFKNGSSDDVVSVVSMKVAVNQAVEDGHIIKPQPPAPTNPPGGIDPPLPPPPPPPPPPQLAWGRYNAPEVAADISMAMNDAREGRKVTVGDDKNVGYFLFRDANTASVLSPALGTLGFALQQAQAQVLTPDGVRQMASVTDGQLTLNFSARQFSTSLNLNSQPTGAVGLQASGSLGADGVFYSRTTGQALAGAVSLDAKSAGYFFEKLTTGGTLSGITLWGR